MKTILLAILSLSLITGFTTSSFAKKTKSYSKGKIKGACKRSGGFYWDTTNNNSKGSNHTYGCLVIGGATISCTKNKKCSGETRSKRTNNNRNKMSKRFVYKTYRTR